MDTPPPLDILLYAHDGRGLGHASRTIAVGMALRRLYPSLKVIFVSGCSLSGDLIGSAPLDWLKIPSYETVVEGGISRGIDGKSNFSDHHIGLLRSRQIADIVKLYKPRLVLVDHSPQGKHKELRPTLEDPDNAATRWILGIRGVVGNVSQLNSPLATTLFQRHYSDLLWYGDSKVLGSRYLEQIGTTFKTEARECGYVSRLRELGKITAISRNRIAGVVSIPWFGETTDTFLDSLYNSLRDIGGEMGAWEIFLGTDTARSLRYHQLFNRLPWCTTYSPGLRYVESLTRARCAIIYGGYNSLVDVLSVPLPALVVLRGMQDGEQQQHVDQLMEESGGLLFAVDEMIPSPSLTEAIGQMLEERDKGTPSINLSGAANCARYLAGLLEQ